MSFNPNVSKQTREVIFSRKQAKSVHPDLVFNNTPVHQTHYQKHLGVYLDMKLNVKLHIKITILKCSKLLVSRSCIHNKHLHIAVGIQNYRH